MRGGNRVSLGLNSAPPYLNEPGQTLYFVMTGEGVDADDVADQLLSLQRDRYLPPEEAE